MICITLYKFNFIFIFYFYFLCLGWCSHRCLVFYLLVGFHHYEWQEVWNLISLILWFRYTDVLWHMVRDLYTRRLMWQMQVLNALPFEHLVTDVLLSMKYYPIYFGVVFGRFVFTAASLIAWIFMLHYTVYSCVHM